MHTVAVRTLRPGLHLLETEVEGFDVRAALLLGARRALLWDTLAHPDQMAHVPELVGDLPLTVVYSHADWDHAWGTCGLERVDEVVAHEVAAIRFGNDVREELSRRRRVDPDTWRAVRLVPPGRTVREELALDLGGLTIVLHALPGHTPDSLVGFVPEWGLLLAGDAVETPLPFVNEREAVARWIAGLDTWHGDGRVRTVVPAHGPVGGRESIARTADYLRAMSFGTPVQLPGDLPSFYRETHERNARILGGPEG